MNQQSVYTNTFFNSDKIEKLLQSSKELSSQLSSQIKVLENLLELSKKNKDPVEPILRISSRHNKPPVYANVVVSEQLEKQFLSFSNPVFTEKTLQSSVNKLESSDNTLEDMSLALARKLTNLENYSIKDTFNLFNGQANEQSLISRDWYNHCFRKIVKSGPKRNFTEKRTIEKLVDSIFKTFSLDSLDINVTKLVSGLSCLCGGSRDDKVNMCFHLFSQKDNNNISLDYLQTYLNCIYTILFLTQKNRPLKMMSATTPEELANTTVNYIYQDLNKNTITLDEFKNWYGC